jgi:mediator of RNA polymerase II transcription subunit 13
MKEDWPSTLSIALVAHYSATARSPVPEPAISKGFKVTADAKEHQMLEVSRTLQAVASDLHALSWLNVGLTYALRRSPLPFHCEVAQRLQRLLNFLGAESGQVLAVV